MIHVFIVASKGIPAQYGGFETFVENLTARKKSEEIYYHVSCMNNDEKHFIYNGADCFNVKVPLKGAPGRILHVSRVLSKIEKWKKLNPNEKTIVYILGCRIGPLLIPHSKKLHKMGVKIFCNPDGLEWKRDKWNKFEKNFLRYCEKCLVLYSDLAICDSKNIEKYIIETYPQMKNRTTYIAYGADIKRSECTDEQLEAWYKNYDIKKNEYYLIVGRFVPENNYEAIIKGFMQSKSQKKLVIISNVEKNRFYQKLQEETHFENDNRICFAGTVYDVELIKRIREEAYAYIHGHEVGGTNPSLLEALASTKLNLLLDVGFNREVAEESAFYWNKSNLENLINQVEKIDIEIKDKMDSASRKRIEDYYDWCQICARYETIFLRRNV